MDNNFSVVILSSGFSERMGEPKALLKWDDTTCFLEKIINEYSKAGCSEIVCVINKKTEPFCKNFKSSTNLKFVLNQYPEWGRFFSIKIGIQAVKDNNFCFIQNVDNPFVSVEIIKNIFAERHSEAWCSPVYMEKGGHPILLPKYIYQKTQHINDNISLIDFLKPFKRIKIETESDTILRNLNKPEDYKRFFSHNSK